jgi:hypothetical protein
MTLGPIDFIALEFPGNQFRGEILAGIQDLVDKQIVRVIDMVIILKDNDGQVNIREVNELGPDELRVVDPMKVQVNSMITRADLDMIAEGLSNNSTAAALLFENLWAVQVKQAILDANGKLLMQERIPHQVVEEAREDLAALGAVID